MLDKNIKDLKMGLDYSKEASTFRVFSSHKDLSLRLYDDSKTIYYIEYKMIKTDENIFEVKIEGDLNGKFYTYSINNKQEVTDPYSISSSINSKRSAIIDLKITDPDGFREHDRPKTKKSESIIYELHVRDFTFNKNSDVKNRGKFLGVVEENRKCQDEKTSLDHLKELGITHVHFMPIYDFLTVDENSDVFFEDENYNWGYDPELYNVPEGSYSVDPADPFSRVLEMKKMIMKLHENGIKVVVDVVYNHIYRGDMSNFEMLYPNYYLRRFKDGSLTNGSGVGNDFDSKKPLYRKFLKDSIEYFINEYKIDGFRFDLLALFDKETTYQLVSFVKSIDPEILIYGEPWAGGSTTLKSSEMTLKGTQKGKGFSCFNDDFRNAIKGFNNDYSLGFAMGDYNLKIATEIGITGSIDYDWLHKGFCKYPSESINYANSHDDLILWDKIDKSLKNTSSKEKKDVYKLANSILFTSFGIPFIHSGNEFLRSKNGVSNTYNGPTSLAMIDWDEKSKNKDIFLFFKDLIELRKKLRFFSIDDDKYIRKNLFFFDFSFYATIGYGIYYSDNLYLFFHNAERSKVSIDTVEILELFNKKLNKNFKLHNLMFEKIFNKNGLYLDEARVLEKIEIDEISTEVYKIYL